jgi:hypothetical protein
MIDIPMHDLFNLLGLVLPLRVRVVIIGVAAIAVGCWTLTLHDLIDLTWTAVVCITAGVVLLGLAIRGINRGDSKPGAGKPRSGAADEEI